MVIGVLKEIKGNEYRVAAVPATVHEIVRHGHTVYVETGAGVGSGFSDAQYEAAGAIIADTNTVWEKADLYYKVKELFPQEFKWMNKDKILYTYIHSNAHPDETDTLLGSHVSAVAYEDVQDEEGKFPLLRPMSWPVRAASWRPCTLPSPSTAAPASCWPTSPAWRPPSSPCWAAAW